MMYPTGSPGPGHVPGMHAFGQPPMGGPRSGGTPGRVVSQERINEIFADQMKFPFRREVIRNFTPPSDQHLEIQERILQALNRIFLEQGSAKGFEQAVHRKFGEFLRSQPDVGMDSTISWGQRLMAAFAAAKAAKQTPAAPAQTVAQPIVTPAVATPTQTVAQPIATPAQTVAQTVSAPATGILSLVSNPTIRSQITPFMERVLHHFKSALDANINLPGNKLSEDEREMLVDDLANFLVKNKDEPLLHSAVRNDMDQFFDSTIMTTEDRAIIRNAVEKAFNGAEEEMRVRPTVTPASAPVSNPTPTPSTTQVKEQPKNFFARLFSSIASFFANLFGRS